MKTHLRVFGSDEGQLKCSPEPKVRITLGELLPLLAVAQQNNFTWLRDFLDDDVKVTSDLYEILRAFRSRRQSA